MNEINSVSNTSIYINDEHISDVKKLLIKFRLKNSLRGNIWEIPTGIIGQLHIEGLEININPNIDYLSNIDYLRLICNNGLPKIKDGYLDRINSNTNVEDRIIYSFIENLHLLSKQGIPRIYSQFKCFGNYYSGNINVVDTYLRCISSEDLPISSKIEKLNINYLQAIAIKSAYIKICNLNTKYRIPSIFNTLIGINGPLLKKVTTDHYLIKKPPRDKIFVESFELATVILNDLNGLKSGLNNSISLLINSNLLFEDFVSDLLMKSFPRERFLLQHSETAAVYKDKTIVSKPDILYLGPKKVVLDIKNKDFDKAISSSNYHQMISYMETFSVDTAILIYPYTKKSEEKLFTIKANKKQKIYAISIDIRTGNFTPFLDQIPTIIQYG